MPNITLFIASEHMPAETALGALGTQCTQLCLQRLDAALENVHIICVPVRTAQGHSVFAEIHYRLGASRTPAVMDAFMAGLDDIIRHNTGLVARIRCFGHASSELHARN
ncbi:MAG TPA: hypothetical protein VM687_09040 [Stenotrophomonas sp.]|nr:hypothetical protein [Stenotrophomonas sp.]